MRRARRGSAAIEYALVTALVAGVILLGASTLGDHLLRATSKISKLDQTSIASATSGLDSVQPTAAAPNPAALDDVPAAADITWHILQLILASGLVVGISFQAFVSMRRARQLQPVTEQAKEKAPSALDKLFEKRQTILKDLSVVISSHHLSELTVGQVMSDHLTVVGKNASKAEIEDILLTQRRHHILVTDENESLAGIISDRDLSRRTGDCAEEVMTSKITFATPGTELIVAATTMINQGISALPVIDEGKLVGILTTTDLTLVLQCVLLLAKREQAAMN